jgi:hypothetical protein
MFLIAKNELDSGEINKKENFDVLYPIRLTSLENNSSIGNFYELKEKYKSLEWEHQILKNFQYLNYSLSLLIL